MRSVRSVQHVCLHIISKSGVKGRKRQELKGSKDQHLSLLGRLQLQRLENPQRFRGLVGKGSRWYINRILANLKYRFC